MLWNAGSLMREIARRHPSRMTNSRIPSQRVRSMLPVAWGHARPTPGWTGSLGRSGFSVLTESPSDRLSPQSEALDELLVAAVILSLEVINQPFPLADDPE